MNVAATDLNLLKAFSALYAERNVTRAGARIGLAQPSMSNALARLRALFDDPLFVRATDGMAPTERAVALAPRIDAALAILADALAPPDAFDPASASADITIAASDNSILTFAPAMIRCFQDVAPKFDLRLRNLRKDTVFADLDRGETDIAIGSFQHIPSRFHQRDFLADEFVCIARKDHPALRDGLSLETFARLPQILTTFRGDGIGAVDQALAEVGLQRRVAMTVAQFGVVPDIVAQTDFLATMPRSAALILAVRSGCRLHPVPFAMPSWTIQMIWSAATQANSAKRFAAERILGLGVRPQSHVVR